MHYSLSRATAWNLAGYTYLIIASFVSTPILLRSLGLAQFGQYALILATLTLLSAFDLGLPQAVVRALVRTRGQFERQQLWATSSLLFVVTGLVSASLATYIAYHLHISFTSLPLIFGLVIMNNLVAHYSNLPHAEGHFGYFNLKTFIVGTGNTLLPAYLVSHLHILSQNLLIHLGIIDIILRVQLLCYLITLFALAYFSLKYFSRPWTYRPRAAVARSLISFGLRNQVGKIAGQIQAQYAKYLLSSVSALALSAYSISTGLIQKVAGGVTQLATALYPQVSSRPIRALYYRLQFGLIVSALFGVILYSLFGIPFLSWWLTDPTIVSAVDQALNILVWSFVLLIPTPLASTVLDGIGHPGTTSLFAVVTVVIEITFALILLPFFNFLAPLYANIISLAITTPILLFVTDRYLLQFHHEIR